MSDQLLSSDIYGYESLLEDDEWEVVLRARSFMETKVAPIADECWGRAEFPHHLLPEFGALGIIGLAYPELESEPARELLAGFIGLELARVDPSIATFYGVHNSLSMGTISRCGSAEQKERWLAPMRDLEMIGAFALTEPEHGSDIAGGLSTTARREGDVWVLDGEKRWIGNATFADLVIVWARDVEDSEVKAFVVERGTPGFTATKIERKLALRTVQNADIVLKDCHVPESNRLQGANSFRDTAKVLRQTRGGVSWSAVGAQMGAYERTVSYVAERKQFGKPLGEFQLVQDLLAKMLGNITASLGMAVRVAQLQSKGVFRDDQAALAKSFTTTRLRETVAWARELFGGNGIVLDYGIARFVGDAEALYSFEGTREINALIVGHSITGKSAFV